MADYSTLADDFYLNMNLNTEMALPAARETILGFFERVQKTYPTMRNFYTRESGDFVLEEDKEQGHYRWISIESRRVCSGYAALSASATYRISTSSEVEPDLRLVKQHLEEHIGGQVQIVSKDEFSGENLFYGIQLSDIVCPGPDADRARPRVAEAEQVDETGSR